MLDIVQLLLSILLGVVAARDWHRHGQSIYKGFGFTLHPAALGDWAAGLLITFIGMTGIFLVERFLGGIRIVGAPFDWATLADNLPSITLGAVFEEVLFRSLLLSGLVVVLGGRKWLAIVLSAVVFGLVHLNNPGASAISAFGNALGGIIYGMAFLGGQNIWLPLGLHFSWNFTQGPIFGFPVSGYTFGGLITQETSGADLLTGGAFGPEAGLVGMLFRFVIMALLLWYLQRRSAGQGDIKSLTFPIKAYHNPATK